ncbi:MAG: DUF4124 domain-containing protein [Pseudomonadota bacterium]|nr:MAG: hypothetical protein DIU74_09375 [Pseudomonadota bacterium]
MPDRLHKVALLGLVAALSQTPSGLAAQQLYRWVDDKGVVHYSDRLPSEATGKAHVQLNRQGVVTKRTAGALSPEELAAREAQERERQEAEKRAREEARKNEALLKTYASAEDIDYARERALAQSREALQNMQHQLAQAEARRDELAQQAKQYEAQGKPLPARLQREVEANEAELATYRSLFEAKQREAAAITQRYDEDKRRYLQLTRGASSQTKASR